MPTTPIDDLIGAINAMGTAFEQVSCEPKEPFIKLPDSGNAPVLDYSIPQKTCFTTNGTILKYIPVEYFKDFTKNIPVNNFYETVANMPVNQAQQFFGAAAVATPMVGTFMAEPMHVAMAPAAAAGVAGGRVTFSADPATTISASALKINKANINMAAQQQNVAMAAPLNVSADHNLINDRAKQGYMPLVRRMVGNRVNQVQYVPKPKKPVPRICIIEEYRTCSYLGNYGAGKVVKTFSLLPGERTTISVRTYHDSSTTSQYSHNAIDSFSDTSATELDRLVQEETGSLESSTNTSNQSGSSYMDTYNSKNSSSAFNISAGASLNLAGIFKAHIGGGYSRSEEELETTGSGMSSSYDYSHSGMRSSNMNVLNSALSKHVQQSNANRQIQVNTSTATTTRSGEETATMREIVNYNKSRVANHAFRQLLQEYTTITYLSNIKFAYTNGYPDSLRVVDLANLRNMLTDIIKSTAAGDAADYIDEVECILLKNYCTVPNWEDEEIPFIEKKTRTFGGCVSQGCEGTETYWRLRSDLEDIYDPETLNIKVKGVILNVSKQTLFTDSLVCDVFLGQGEALDCFNQKAQDAENQRLYIGNLQGLQNVMAGITENAARDYQKTIISDLATAEERADKYKKVYGDCCDVPQSGCCPEK